MNVLQGIDYHLTTYRELAEHDTLITKFAFPYESIQREVYNDCNNSH